MSDIVELVKLARNGDDGAMNEILTSYRYIVTFVAKKFYLIGGEKEDIIQDGMVGLFKAINTYDESKGATFKTYATTLITRNIISAIRNNNTESKRIMKDTVYLEDEDMPASGSTPELDIIGEENYRELSETVFKNLSEFEKTVVEYHLKGFGYVDIAKKLNKTPKSIDNALRRIKTKLKFLKERV